MTIWIAVGLFAVLGCLAAAGFFMLQRSDDARTQAQRSRRMARALALRVGVSVLVFAGILLAHWLGWIQPSAWAPR